MGGQPLSEPFTQKQGLEARQPITDFNLLNGSQLLQTGYIPQKCDLFLVQRTPWIQPPKQAKRLRGWM